jgi:hypothetical protein
MFLGSPDFYKAIVGVANKKSLRTPGLCSFPTTKKHYAKSKKFILQQFLTKEKITQSIQAKKGKQVIYCL